MQESHTFSVIDTMKVCDTTRVDIRSVGDTLIIKEYRNVTNEKIKLVGKTDTIQKYVTIEKAVPEKSIKKVGQILGGLVFLLAFCLVLLFGALKHLIKKYLL